MPGIPGIFMSNTPPEIYVDYEILENGTGMRFNVFTADNSKITPQDIMDAVTDTLLEAFHFSKPPTQLGYKDEIN